MKCPMLNQQRGEHGQRTGIVANRGSNSGSQGGKLKQWGQGQMQLCNPENLRKAGCEVRG